MKKIPLYCGIFLITIWGASKKVVPFLRTDELKKKEVILTTSYFNDLEESLDLSTISWAEFYRIFRPQVSQLVTDEALYEVYKKLKKQKRLVIRSKR